MTSLQVALKTSKRGRRKHESGQVSLTEAMVAGVASTLIVAATALSMQSTAKIINNSATKATLRQNTVNGMRLMRSEVERGLHLIVHNANPFPDAEQHLNLQDPRYSDALSECTNLAGTQLFKPLFGIKMVELSKPVVYGLTSNNNGYGYTIQRCGPPLKLDGSFDETEELFLSNILEQIAALPLMCGDEPCPPQPVNEVLSQIDFSFNQGVTPLRSPREPALRMETDSNFKLMKFIDPTPNTDNEPTSQPFPITASYLQKTKNGVDITKQNVYFTAFARADKRLNNTEEDLEGGILSGAFFQNITSSNVRFVIDGSGSMSACVMWGDGYGIRRTFYDPKKNRYKDTNRICALTRMEALISEMTMLIGALPNNTKIGITSFSSNGYTNHKTWSDSTSNLVSLGADGKRDSAIEFVNTLNDDQVTRWGGTDPWDSIQQSFDDTETDTLYFLTDGKPNKDPNGGKWSRKDETRTAERYASENEGRTHNGSNQPLIVNTTSIGMESSWLTQLAALTSGSYNQIDEITVANNSNNGHGNNLGDCDPSNPSANFDHCDDEDDIELSGNTP